MYKVLFHLNEPDKQEAVLTNIENTLKDFTENEINIKLVIHSKAIISFTKKEKPDLDRINKLLEKNVEIGICSNTMKNLNIEREDFEFKISVVSSAMGELIRCQKDGWLYIKP